MKKKFLMLLLLLPAGAAAGQEVYLESSACSFSHTDDAAVPARSAVIIDREEIKKMPVQDLAGLLEQSGLANVQQRGAFGLQGDISIRGATFDQYLLMVNGIPVNDPQTGHHNLDLPIPLASIDRIEITGGQGSSLYGSYGQGGTVNIITTPAFKKHWQAELNTGQNNSLQAGVTVSVPLADTLHGFSLQHLASGGWRDDTDFNTNTVNYQLVLLHPGGDTSLFAGYTQKDFGAYKFYSAAFPDEFEKTRTFLFTGRTRLCLNNREFQPQVSFRQHRDYFVLDRNRPDWSFNNHLNSSVTLGLPCTFYLPGYTAVVGLDLKQDAIDSTNLQQHHRDLYSLYMEYLPKLDSAWKLQAGLRDDFYSGYSGNGVISPSFNADYSLNQAWTYLLGLGRSFRVPTFTELYYRDPSSRGDANLAAEKGWNYDTGFKYRQGNWDCRNTVFWRDIREAIDWVKSDTESVSQAKNITLINSYGWESVLNYRRLLRLNYQYLNSAVDASGNNSRYSTAYLKHQLIIKAGYEGPAKIRPDLVITYRKPNQAANYWLVDLKISREFNRNWTAYIQGTNLLNTYYEEAGGVPRPGRWLLFGLTWQA
jgi:vitamin B12 transporter